MSDPARTDRPSTVELERSDAAHPVVARFDLRSGGRLAALDVGVQSLLADRPVGGDGIGWGAYAMAPWAGRVRNGRFPFDGVDHQLECNHTDQRTDDRVDVAAADLVHAIHGTVTEQTWTLEAHGSTDAQMSCALGGAAAWPFGGSVTSTVTLGPTQLTWTLEVTAADGERFPAVIGWHPWFAKPDDLTFAPAAMYERDAAGLPTGRLVAPSDGPWDDCFRADGPVQLHYAREIAPTVTVASDCDHWVVFDMPDDATCVEPQSGPPNAFNLRDFRVHVVDHTTPLRRTMAISW